MKNFSIARPGERLAVLCLGADSDDIEIGAGATLLGWIEAGVKLDVYWAVLSGEGERADEARASAADLLTGAARFRVEVANFRDAYFPYHAGELKTWMRGLRDRFEPDVILTHSRTDAHQDHREISCLTTKAFRDHLTLEYEIPKWDGDLGRPNFYVPVSARALDRKIRILETHFTSQRCKDWFDADTFRGLARIRGMECRAPERFAEAFRVRKFIMS